ncbi:DNA topoisomerase IB [Pseudolabrys taiwanensis]|uniref:DNA topoisomerase IB n=2 Tax=Pseudolabrys taiwanensis TaxID=331696 RepID=A0A345ZZD9_9HYPH|nr:DNA topoisomerase IB [Pseudolabrys taiwanensis]
MEPAAGNCIPPNAMHQNARTTSRDNVFMRSLGLRYATVEELTIRRRRNGTGFVYVNGRGRRLRDERTIYRLKRLAVPPAYEDVVYADDPHAHLQARGRDSAGRAQYRYHPDWEKVRELRKARRLAKLAVLLPKVRSWVARQLRGVEPTKDFAVASVIALVAATALRPGSEAYVQQHGTRGAATLLKSNMSIRGATIVLRFRGKGGKAIEKTVESRPLARALKLLCAVPGKRLFQYRAEDGVVRHLRRRDINIALRAITKQPITLKDFRTLNGSAIALQELAAIEAKSSIRGRRRQILATMRCVAAELANTPSVCRKSYVHAAVVEAFESGMLHALARKHAGLRAPRLREKLLMEVLATTDHLRG